MIKKKNILISGSCGLCGQNLVQYFQNKYNVICIDKKELTGKYTIKHDLQYPIPASLIDLPVDYIIHLAAIIDQKEKDPYKMMKNNMLSAYNMLEFSIRKKVKRFVYASSSSIYSKPMSSYGLSKHLGEELVNNYSMIHSLPTTIFRLGYVIGTPLPKRYFIYKIIKKLKHNKPILIENPDNIFSFVAVEDIAIFCEKAFRENISGTFNLTGVPKTIREVFEELQTLFSYNQSEIKIKLSKAKFKHMFDVALTEKHFGLKLRDPFQNPLKNNLII